MRTNVAAEREDGAEVNLQDVVPIRGGELVGRMTPLDASAVDEDVDGMVVGENGGNERGDG